MTVQEEPFCEVKGEHVVIFNIKTIFQKILSSPRLSFENIYNAITVAKDCWKGKSDSWLVNMDLELKPIVTTIPIIKRKPSEQTVNLMIEYYQTAADDDLALAKEFEEIEPAIDDDCGE